MANADVRKGLIPMREKGSSVYNGAAQPYFCNSSYATALFLGDPVVKNGTSNTAAAGVAKKFAAGTLPEVELTTAGDGNATTGVIVGFEANPDGLGQIYRSASTERVAYVVDDPDVVFEIQTDSANATAATDVGANANIVYTHAGDTNTGLSGAELNTASMTTTSTYQLKMLRLVDREDNELGENSKFEVLINNHTEEAGTDGI